jgi:CHRD domain
MKRLAVVAIVLAIGSTACGSSSTSPSDPNKPTFQQTLLPANEVPPIANAEASGTGLATVTFEVTRDSAGNITSGTASFSVTMTGFPPGTPFNIAHIHQGAAGTNGSIVFSTTLVAGEAVANAQGTAIINKTGIPGTPAVMQQIINNPSVFYFNVHSTLNPGGVARGQLVKVG